MTKSEFLAVEDRRIEYRFAGPGGAGATDIVLLHEGLGCVSMWREFPELLAEATGCRVLAYSRLGHGRSSPPARARTPDYHFDESSRWLSALLDGLGVRQPVLYGHSDGATIALIRAAERPRSIRGVVAIAPHLKVEDITIDGLARAKAAYQTTALRSRLAVHHEDVDAVFWAWNRTWLEPAFRGWNIEHVLPAIEVPVLAIQGVDDGYATLEQIDCIARAVPGTERLVLDGCGHAPHRERPAAVLEASRHFIDRILAPPAAG